MEKQVRTGLTTAVVGGGVIGGLIGVLVGVLLVSAGCSTSPQAAASEAEASASAAPAESADPPAAAVPHGDHNPHHGGVVFMHGETHFEAVLARDGRHRIYFSDAVRADLPASVVSDVSVIISRPGAGPETLPAHVDETGESWVAEGQPVGPGEATARIAFTSPDGPYWIDLPFPTAEP